MRIGRTRDERGSVVAEFAVALPAVAVVLLLGAGALAACAVQVRVQDAAADAARLAARGENDAKVATVTEYAGAAGASVAVDRRGDLVCATVTAPAVRAASIALGSMSATACALDGGR